jgi:phage terminase large subunit-like protein
MTPDDVYTFVGEVVDDETFSYVCALDKGDDPLEDPSCWIKSNPLLGITVKADYLAGVVRQAKAIPGKLNGILRLHFCVWTDSDTAWMGRPALEAVLAEFDPGEVHVAAAMHAAADLSGTQDLTALAGIVQTGTVKIDRPVQNGAEGETVSLELPTYDAWVEACAPRRARGGPRDPGPCL